MPEDSLRNSPSCAGPDRTRGDETTTRPQIRIPERAGRPIVSAALLAVVFGVWGPAALADDCLPTNELSPCVNSDELWPTPAPSPFVSIPWAAGLEKGAFAVGAAGGFIYRPISLQAASPDPGGREVRVVDWSTGITLMFAYGVLKRVDARLSAPFVLYQQGAGVAGATSQSASGIAAQAVRNPIVGVSYTAVNETEAFALAVDLDVALPIGTNNGFAGAIGPVVELDIGASGAIGRWSYGAIAGVRMLRTAPLGSVQIGTSADVRLGAGFDIFENGLLGLTLEGWMLPSLVGQTRELPDGSRVLGATIIPAEWLFSVRSALGAGFTLQLGGGTGIPISSEQRISPSGIETSETFASIPAPKIRSTLLLRYAPVVATKP